MNIWLKIQMESSPSGSELNSVNLSVLQFYKDKKCNQGLGSDHGEVVSLLFVHGETPECAVQFPCLFTVNRTILRNYEVTKWNRRASERS